MERPGASTIKVIQNEKVEEALGSTVHERIMREDKKKQE